MEKQFMEKIKSSLSSCHFRNLPDVVDSSILISRNHQPSTKTTSSPKLQSDGIGKPTNLSDFFKLAAARRVSVSDSKITKTTTSSSNTSGWFTIEDAKNETEPITSVSSSFSSSSSSFSEGSNSDVAAASRSYETSENRWSGCDSKMGFSLSEVSVGVEDSSGREFIISQQNAEKSWRKPRAKSRQRRVIKKLSHEDDTGEMLSSFISTHIYYGGDCRRKTTNGRRKTRKKGSRGKGRIEEMTIRSSSSSYGKVVEESYAVEKSSSDPYNDFRVSMVEMILEKEFYGENELEKLLECFLYLNSAYHHEIIIRVFLEVCTTLFPPPQ